MNYKILQLTDLHLFQSPGHNLFGVDTNQKFLKVLEHIKASNFEFDCIFLTGDLSQDETSLSYEIIAEALSPFNKHIYWIAGNHDDYPKMRDVFSKYPLFKQNNPLFLKQTNWSFIFVDTVLTGEDNGYLIKEKIKAFSDTLLSIPDTTAIAIVMHHHPVPVGTPLIDQFILKNADDFLRAIAKNKRKVEVVICGHVHGNYDITTDEIRVISSPATCLQWKKGTTELLIDDVSGFTLWTFSENGNFNYETFLI